MAIAIMCLERVLEEPKFASPMKDRLLDVLWLFVETNDLGDWEKQAAEVTWPIDRFFIFGQKEFLQTSGFNHWPMFVLKMVID